LERILANFVANAETHGGGLTAIRVSAASSHVSIGVEDEGPGIPSDEAELIFDRFARGAMAGRRRSTDGTGLGLALASENARLLGGRVFVDVDRPRGARLVVELPLVSP
jgi:signal transduction histidine kinase